ncbi:MAG: acetyl-CoA carboxylase biotin carboxyl carrier protein [Bacteroidetes bacterium]|jgi:acetyl-CoA carboxylase biotin carboxyl carrier protein|nr:acetyl-CoA carboxylase biotin carboxyl carrier protein [Bacteroidota bacterium]
MDIKQIQDLIRFVAKSGVEEVELEQGNFKLTIRTKSTGSEPSPAPMYYPQAGYLPPLQPSQSVTSAPTTAAAPPSAEMLAPSAGTAASATSIEIKAPMIGTFYRSSGPGKDAFIKVGDRVEKGQVVCIIEAMKLFNEIESDVSGKVVKVLADDSSPVEYDQPLFLVEP